MTIFANLALFMLSISALTPTFAAVSGYIVGQPMVSERHVAFANGTTIGTSHADECKAKLILPLDHGPRAQSTPWLNQQRRLDFEKKCDRKATE